MKTALWIAGRLRPSQPGMGGRRRGPSRTGVVIAVAGIALSLAVMMLAVAVMNGFSHEIRSKIEGFEPQITVTALNGDELSTMDIGLSGTGIDARLSYTPLSLTDAVKNALDRALPKGYSAVVETTRPAMLKSDDAFEGLVLKTDSRRTDSVADASEIEISRLTAEALGVNVGDRLTACFFINEGMGAMKVRRLTVSHVYDTGFGEYDSSVAFVSPTLLASIDRLAEGEGSRIEIRGLEDNAVDDATEALRNELLTAYYSAPEDGALYTVDNIHQRGAMYFNWLAMLDTNVVVILALMAVVAAFTLVSSLFVLVLERVRMIGLLKALGASNRFVRSIFVYMLERLVVIGLTIGNVAALGIIAVQRLTHFLRLDPATYYLDYVAMKISMGEVVLLNMGILVLAALVLIVPSRIVSGLSPSRTLRYE